MDEGIMASMNATAERLANAAEALDRVLAKLEAQQEALNARVDRIVAAVEEQLDHADKDGAEAGALQVRERVVELEKANEELKAQAARAIRKTLPPFVSQLIAKDHVGNKLDGSSLNKILQALTVDQRIAVKAEMARAGMIEWLAVLVPGCR